MKQWMAAAALVLAVPAANGGSGSYIVAGRSLYVALYNGGPSAWRAFALTAPAGTSFVGGTTGNESSASCTVDAAGTTIQCGPIGPTVMPPLGHLTFGATMTTPVACDETLQLRVSADGTTYTRITDIGAAADCARALTQPTLRRTGAKVRAKPPTWSSPPASRQYRWLRCAGSTCKPIPGATGRTLMLTRRDVGRAVRLVVTASVSGVQLRTTSAALRIR